jgi:hypothetical protein
MKKKEKKVQKVSACLNDILSRLNRVEKELVEIKKHIGVCSPYVNTTDGCWKQITVTYPHTVVWHSSPSVGKPGDAPVVTA